MAKRRFGEFLIQKNVLNQQQLAAILKLKQGSSQRLGQLLVEQKILSEEQLTALLGEFFGLPVFTAEQVELSQQVLSAVPQAVAVKYQIVPVANKNNSLYVDEYKLLANSQILEVSINNLLEMGLAQALFNLEVKKVVGVNRTKHHRSISTFAGAGNSNNILIGAN
ncbi:hypothetical protein M1N70_03065 [Peptococcaceae bacterium]|nr:hypothetical protein [Peptococcaceae bacterium]